MAAADEPAAPLPGIEIHEVDRDGWPDFERLFAGPGWPKMCWCTVWRATPEESKKTDGASRKAAMKRRIDEGVPVGLLAYLDGEPVAWCSIAPRPTYRRLGGPEDPDLAPDRVWSLVCFFVSKQARGRGVMKLLLGSAIQHARERGAAIVEAYPVDADSPSYRYMGFVPTFEAAGFQEVGRAGTRRHVMRLQLS